MEEFKISFGCLNRGQLYPIVSAEKTVSEFYGKKSNGIKVKIVDEDDLELTTWLPKKLVDSVDDTQFEDIVKAGKSESPDSKFKVCYYGKVESAKTTIFVGRIHKPNEGRNEKLFKDTGLVMKRYSIGKRNNEDENTEVQKKSKTEIE